MQQIFAPEIRRRHNVSKLITFDVHRACDTAYQSEEDYFVRSLTPFARGSEAGNAIYAKVLNDFRTGRQVPLTTMVLREFDPNPSGLLLPGGKVVKRFDGERLRRVAWNMVRGLDFHHTGEVLPEEFTVLNETPIASAIAGCVIPLSRSNTIWMRSRCAAGIFHRRAIFSSRICFLVHLTIRPPNQIATANHIARLRARQKNTANPSIQSAMEAV